MVDADLAEVIFDHGDAESLVFGEDAVEKGGFARAEEAGESKDPDPGSSDAEELLRSRWTAFCGELPPLECVLGRQPGLAFRQAADGTPATGSPIGAESFEHPLLVVRQPTQEGVEGIPALLDGARYARLPPRNRSLIPVQRSMRPLSRQKILPVPPSGAVHEATAP